MNNTEKFIPTSPLKTPVLFLIFNRLDTTKRVFEQIKKAKPQKLYIAADGPREHVKGEAEKVEAVREYVLSNINWDCEVKTLFRDKNLGCGRAVSEGISWFFDNEEQGIILEDDTVPSLSFFWFCQELLEKYKDEPKIWHIAGFRFNIIHSNDNIIHSDSDYFFSAINYIWGWATWSNRWNYYDFELKTMKDDNFIANYWKGSALKYWKKIFKKMKNKEIDTWDYQWTFTIWFNRGLAILPKVSLVKNIGFGSDATHTIKQDDRIAKIESAELILKNHPYNIERNIEYDELVYKHLFASPPIFVKIYKKIKRIYATLKTTNRTL